MKLVLKRDTFRDDCTLGLLFIDGKEQCHTLEDKVREVKGFAAKFWKIPGKTAIPYGTYELEITDSPRFKTKLPLLKNVPGFEGIRIHPGNFARDTEGCILVGMDRGHDYLEQSRKAFDLLMQKLAAAKGTITIEITE